MSRTGSSAERIRPSQAPPSGGSPPKTSGAVVQVVGEDAQAAATSSIEVSHVLAGHLGRNDQVLALLVCVYKRYVELVGPLRDLLDLTLGDERKERRRLRVGAAVGNEVVLLGLEDQHVKEGSRPHDEYKGDDAVAQEPVIQGKLSSRGRLAMLPASDYRAGLRSANLTEVPFTRHTRFGSLRLRCQQTRW